MKLRPRAGFHPHPTPLTSRERGPITPFSPTGRKDGMRGIATGSRRTLNIFPVDATSSIQPPALFQLLRLYVPASIQVLHWMQGRAAGQIVNLVPTRSAGSYDLGIRSFSQRR